MKIAVVQPDLLWENKAENLSNLEKIITPLYGRTDIVILPEMFTTGFTMNTDAVSEPADGATFSWMNRVARSGNMGICGSYVVKEEGKVYNRFVFAGPSSEYWFYDKHHLFSMGEEDHHFSRGDRRLVFSFRGFRIAPFICYDLRFPVWNRNLNDTDLIIYTANWPAVRINVWNILIRARAIENQCFVAASNRIGTDGMGIHYSGESAIIDPKGETIAMAGKGTGQIITADLDIGELTEFRKKFPVLDDADKFSVNL